MRKIIVFVAAAVLLWCPKVLAEDVFLPSIVARGTYDDNLFLDDQSDFELTLSPGLEFQRNTAQGSLSLSGQADVFAYLDHDEYERVNQRYALSSSYAANEDVILGFNAGFQVDHTFLEQLEETGEVTDKERRYRFNAQPSLTWMLSSRTQLYVGINAGATDYDEEREDNRDSTSYGTTLVLTRQWSPILDVFGRLSVSRSELDDERIDFGSVVFEETDFVQDTVQASLGVDYEYTENLTLSFSGGGSLTRTQYDQTLNDVFIEEKDDDTSGFILDAGLTWQQETRSVSLSYSRSLTQDADGESLNRDRLSASLNWDLSERLNANLRGSFVNSQSVEDEEGVDDVDTQRYVGGTGMSYELTDNSDLGLHYSYTYVDDKADDETDERNRVWLQYRYQFPYFM